MPKEEEEERQVSERGMSEGFREALEGAFATTGRTRERAQDLTDRVIDEVTRLGQGARGAITGRRAPAGSDLESLEQRVQVLEQRLAELEGRKTTDEGPG